jgi:hypothetical protein
LNLTSQGLDFEFICYFNLRIPKQKKLKTFNSLILWAGKIANDFNFEAYNFKHPKTQNYIVFGNDDEFYTAESVLEYKKELKNFDAEWIQHTGGHTIDQDTLERIAGKFD